MNRLKVKLSLLTILTGCIMCCTQVKADEEKIVLTDVKISSALQLNNRKNRPNLVQYLGKPVTARLLQQVLDEVTRYYRQLGFTDSTAYLPEQTSTNGQIMIKVIQPHVDSVEIENNSRLKPKALRRLLGDNYSARLRQMSLEDIQAVFLKFGDINAVKTSGFYERYDNSDNLRLMVGMEDPKYLNFEVFTDNHGTKASGEWRSGFSVQSTNLTGNADRAGLFYARSNEKQNNFSLNYSLPVNSFFTQVGASLCYQDYELSGKYRILGAQGSSLSAELFFKQPLLRTLQSKLDITGGLRYRDIVDEFKSFDLKFQKHTVQGYLGINGFKRFDRLYLEGGISAYYGRIYNDDQYVLLEDHDFTIFNADSSLYCPLNETSTLVNTIQIQYANTTVDSADTFQASGPLGVAAYSSSTLTGDSGFVESLGLRFKPFDNIDLTITPHLDFGYAKYHSYSGDSILGSGILLEFFYKGAFVKAQTEYALTKINPDEDRTRVLIKFGYQYV